MDTPNPSADQGGGGGAGAASPDNMEAPLAVEQSSVPLTGTGGGAAQTVSSGGPGRTAALPIDGGFMPSAPERTMEASLARTGTGGAARAIRPVSSMPTGELDGEPFWVSDLIRSMDDDYEIMEDAPPILTGPPSAVSPGGPGGTAALPRLPIDFEGSSADALHGGFMPPAPPRTMEASLARTGTSRAIRPVSSVPTGDLDYQRAELFTSEDDDLAESCQPVAGTSTGAVHPAVAVRLLDLESPENPDGGCSLPTLGELFTSMDDDPPLTGPPSAPPLSVPSSDTSATATPLEDSTLRLASGLEFMNLTGGEPPVVVEGPSISTARKRTPGKWRRIPRPERTTEYLWRPRGHSADVKAMMDKWDASTLENIEQIRNMSEKDCDLFTAEDRREFHAFKRKMIPALTRLVKSKPENTFFTYKTFSDTKEEHLTAEGMEAQVLAKFPDRQPCQQAVYFAELAMAHYNLKKKHKFKLATTLLSNCFSESCGTTYGHVNFTGILEEKTAAQPTSNKRLFFAELMLIPKLQAKAESQPMRVVHVYTIDDDSCYGGCHEMFRKIDHKMRHVMDYERCHACSDRIKHPKGQLFDGGHNSSRMPYYSAI